MNLLRDEVLHLKVDLDHIHADIEHLVGELGDRCKDCNAYQELLMHVKELDEHISIMS